MAYINAPFHIVQLSIQAVQQCSKKGLVIVMLLSSFFGDLCFCRPWYVQRHVIPSHRIPKQTDRYQDYPRSIQDNPWRLKYKQKIKSFSALNMENPRSSLFLLQSQSTHAYTGSFGLVQ